MRFLVAILSCLMVLAVTGPAAGATVSCAAPMAMQTASMEKTDCGMCPDTPHKCDHEACCGYQVGALSSVVHPARLTPPRTPGEAAVAKHLSSSGPDTLLDPPRA